MDQERHEVYERIPWESLQKQGGGDRQWLLIAIAGAVAVGALAYSFVRAQPALTAAAPPEIGVSETSPTASIAPAPVATTVATPVVVAEADLYAVDPERLIDAARSHAEWFAVEYFSADGSEESRSVLTSLMPVGMPAPEVPPGTQVFVDWVGTRGITEMGPLAFDVDVIVRSLVSKEDGVFMRQPPRLATITVRIDGTGRPQVVGAPMVSPVVSSPSPLTLTQVPTELQARVESTHGPVVGGAPMADGRWRVVVMMEGIDGVLRPTTIVVP